MYKFNKLTSQQKFEITKDSYIDNLYKLNIPRFYDSETENRFHNDQITKIMYCPELIKKLNVLSKIKLSKASIKDLLMLEENFNKPDGTINNNIKTREVNVINKGSQPNTDVETDNQFINSQKNEKLNKSKNNRKLKNSRKNKLKKSQQ